MVIDKSKIGKIYDDADGALKRFEKLSERYNEIFHSERMEFFTSPGRTEIIGNHTDHNGGKVIAASITLDTIGAAFPNGSNIIEIVSEGYDEKITLNINDTTEESSFKGTAALVKGIVKAVIDFGYRVKGFNLYASTNVIPGAGVSSSASFEMLLCTLISYFFNENGISPVECAKIGQYAENVYWKKASGLMDQMSCLCGGAVKFDFSDGVRYKKINLDFKKYGYDMVIVNTGSGHSDLSEEYSSIPLEMKSIAKELGCDILSESSLDVFLEKIPSLIEKMDNDRAILRSLHFYNETNRVDQMEKAIESCDIERILSLINESGRSSFEYLQNCYVNKNPKEQKISLCLAITDLFLSKKGKGAFRVHGGGFAGVIMAIVPSEVKNEYIDYMKRFVGENNVYLMNIRKTGACHIE